MRVINIKIFNHHWPYNVFFVVLLLYCTSLIAMQNYETDSRLIENAQQQQDKLIESYGLSQYQPWLDKCQTLINILELQQFERCLIIKATFANAYSLAHGSVILTEGLLQNINNDDQLAHVLVHEHAHLHLKHHQQAQQLINNPPKLFTKSRIKKFYRRIEQQADLTADDELIKQQRDPLQIHHYLLRIEKNTKEHSNDHQKLKHRIQRNNLPVEVIEAFWGSE